MNLLDLPGDILLQVILRLSHKDLARVSASCRKCHALVNVAKNLHFNYVTPGRVGLRGGLGISTRQPGAQLAALKQWADPSCLAASQIVGPRTRRRKGSGPPTHLGQSGGSGKSSRRSGREAQFKAPPSNRSSAPPAAGRGSCRERHRCRRQQRGGQERRRLAPTGRPAGLGGPRPSCGSPSLRAMTRPLWSPGLLRAITPLIPMTMRPAGMGSRGQRKRPQQAIASASPVLPLCIPRACRAHVLD